MFGFDKIVSAIRRQSRPGLSSQAGSHEDQWDAPHHLAKNFQRLGSAPVGAGIFRHDQVKRLFTKLFDTLPQGQDDIRMNRELRPLELLQARVDFVGIAVNEKDPQGRPPICGCTPVGTVVVIQPGLTSGQGKHWQYPSNPT
jgi:hypothetical protein